MKRTIQLITSLFCFALGANALYAVSGTWGAYNVSGDWGDASKWAASVIADGAGFMADTPQHRGGTTTITLDTDRTIGFVWLRPNDSGPGISNRLYVLNGPGILTLSDPATNLTYYSGPRIDVRDGISVCNAVIAGNEGMGTCNLGILFLTASNTYTGDTLIHRARLQVGNVDALPHGSRTGNVILAVGGNPLDVTRLDLQDLDITINGLNSATNPATPLNSNACQVTTFSSTAGTSTLTVGDNDANGQYFGDIVDGLTRTIALTKIGTGTQTLSAFYTFTGGTTVNAGMLVVDGTLGSYLGTVTINGGVLGGSGTISDPVVAAADGSISGGSSVGKLTLYYGLDLSAGGTNIWELGTLKDDSTGVAGTDFDQIEETSSSLDVTNATLSVRLGGVNTADPFWTSSHSWTVISSPSGSGASNFKTIEVLGGTPAGSFSTANTGSGIVLTFTPGAAPAPKPRITSISGAGTASVTVNYTNTVATTNYILQYNTNLSTANWYNVGTKAAAGTSDSQTDTTAIPGETQRYYRVRVQ